MRDRCLNQGNDNYHNYGGRGIAIDPRWDDFAAFVSDMGPKPTSSHSVDRIDNDGNYSPQNCRWATKMEQRHNQRPARCATCRSVDKESPGIALDGMGVLVLA